MADELDAILPEGAVAVERGAIGGQDAGSGPTPDLYAAEEKLIAGASERRRREFAEARWCAREALRRLGVAASAIPATPDGAPVWPDGVVGSITHKGGYRAAVVARRADLAGIGIDAEPDERLPAGVLETIASAAELDRVEALLERRPGLAWDRLLFCAKEAAVKAAYPTGLGVAGARGVDVTLDADAHSLSASRGARRPTVDRRPVGSAGGAAGRGRKRCVAGKTSPIRSGRPDSNRRPPAPRAGALPGCATSRCGQSTSRFRGFCRSNPACGRATSCRSRAPTRHRSVTSRSGP